MRLRGLRQLCPLSNESEVSDVMHWSGRFRENLRSEDTNGKEGLTTHLYVSEFISYISNLSSFYGIYSHGNPHSDAR